MTIAYTTAWAQQQTKTLEQWQEWVKGLKRGDRVLSQQFIPRGNYCLDSQVECWRFVEARYIDGNMITYEHDQHPIKDGYQIYWGADAHRWGDVFDARIVPWHSDVAPKDKDSHRDCHASIFDEVWSLPGCYRHLVLVERRFRSPFNQIKQQFSRCYKRDVTEGNLIIIFGDWEDVTAEKIDAIDGARYLYSERLHR
jgi:hypothetical protein